jgi:hypothetical protein
MFFNPVIVRTRGMPQPPLGRHNTVTHSTGIDFSKLFALLTD